ncbi:MAG: hypothetical protein RLZZ126_299 [Pseudomonadota bacterium]|jgi:two-component system, LuxR family, response regulator DctR
MTTTTDLRKATVYLVDDDASVRDALSWLLRSRRMLSHSFASSAKFQEFALATDLSRDPACLLLDVRMPGMSGLELFDWMVQRGLHEATPVIFLTGHADVPTAVATVKRGAFDFCEKPFSDNVLVDRVEQALQQSARVVATRSARLQVQGRLDSLTERERDVMQLIVAGQANKQIADRLSISVRTVEVHRARVFEKMNVKSAVELVNLL